jgi:hypothetical protein
MAFCENSEKTGSADTEEKKNMIDKRTELMCRAYASTKHLLEITYPDDYSQQIIEKLKDPSALSEKRTLYAPVSQI